MDTPIFPHCSYFLALAAGKEVERQLAEIGALRRVRIFVCRDRSSFETAAGLMHRLAGSLIFSDGVEAQDLEALKSVCSARAVPTRVVSSSLSSDALGEAIDELIGSMIPKGLGEVCIYSANLVLPTFFAGLTGFHQIPCPAEIYSLQMNFSLVAGDLVGHCSARAKLDRLAALLPQGKRANADEILREAWNQCLGVISQNLTRLGINSKLGLPTLFDLSKMPEVQTLVFFPSVHITDANRLLCLSVGFHDLGGQPLFDLSGAAPSTDSGGVDFL